MTGLTKEQAHLEWNEAVSNPNGPAMSSREVVDFLGIPRNEEGKVKYNDLASALIEVSENPKMEELVREDRIRLIRGLKKFLKSLSPAIRFHEVPN